eukprot:m51a1_g13286 hypothetical protein (297) ;mRNA; r:383-2164
MSAGSNKHGAPGAKGLQGVPPDPIASITLSGPNSVQVGMGGALWVGTLGEMSANRVAPFHFISDLTNSNISWSASAATLSEIFESGIVTRIRANDGVVYQLVAFASKYTDMNSPTFLKLFSHLAVLVVRGNTLAALGRVLGRDAVTVTRSLDVTCTYNPGLRRLSRASAGTVLTEEEKRLILTVARANGPSILQIKKEPVEVAEVAGKIEERAPQQDERKTAEDLGFVCPITLQLMSDPVATADCHVYEREAITEWLVGHTTSPITGLTLPSRDLTDMPLLKRRISRWKRQHPGDW